MIRFIMRRFTSFFAEIGLLPKLYQHNCFLILFENQIQTASTSPCRTQVQPAANFLVCSLIFIEYKLEKREHKNGQGCTNNRSYNWNPSVRPVSVSLVWNWKDTVHDTRSKVTRRVQGITCCPT